MAGAPMQRPYSTFMPAGQSPRSPEFNAGINGDPNPGASSLEADSADQQSMVPHGFTPNSILQALRPSMNGESATDYRRVLPGGYVLPSANGQAQSSYQTSNLLRMQGQNSQ